MSSELKACPFCGCKPSTTTYYIECDCAMEPRIDWFHVSRESAIANWNRRTPSPAVRALVESAKEWREADDQLRGPFGAAAPQTAMNRLVSRTVKLREALAAVEREIGGA